MKHHNNLDDDQIHLPKGFQTAHGRSLYTKNAQGGLDWVKANYRSSAIITTVADIEGRLHHAYFTLYSSYDASKYAVYFNITGTGTFTTPTGYTSSIEVDCTESGVNSTAIEVAIFLNSVISAHTDFSSTRVNEDVTITGLTTATEPLDVNTSFLFSTIETKIVSELIGTDVNGDFIFLAQSEVGTRSLGWALSAETGVFEVGTNKLKDRLPYGFEVTEVRASLSRDGTGTTVVDININGTSILSTKLSIDAGETTSTTAATAAVISTSTLSDDDEISFDVDTYGADAEGLKVRIIGYLI